METGDNYLRHGENMGISKLEERKDTSNKYWCLEMKLQKPLSTIHPSNYCLIINSLNSDYAFSFHFTCMSVYENGYFGHDPMPFYGLSGQNFFIIT